MCVIHSFAPVYVHNLKRQYVHIVHVKISRYSGQDMDHDGELLEAEFERVSSMKEVTCTAA